MKFLGVSGVYDYAGLSVGSRYRSQSFCFRQSYDVGVLIGVFEALYPAHLYPCLRFAERLAALSAKLGAEQVANPFS